MFFEKTRPFLLRAQKEKIAEAVRQYGNLIFHQLDAGAFYAIKFSLDIIGRDGKMMNFSFLRKVVVISLDQFELCLVSVLKA